MLSPNTKGDKLLTRAASPNSLNALPCWSRRRARIVAIVGPQVIALCRAQLPQDNPFNHTGWIRGAHSDSNSGHYCDLAPLRRRSSPNCLFIVYVCYCGGNRCRAMANAKALPCESCESAYQSIIGGGSSTCVYHRSRKFRRAWTLARVPCVYRPRSRAIQQNGRVVRTGRDRLKEALRGIIRNSFSSWRVKRTRRQEYDDLEDESSLRNFGKFSH